jgi:hypothetical protein
VIGLGDVVALRRVADRERDRRDLKLLEAARQERNRAGRYRVDGSSVSSEDFTNRARPWTAPASGDVNLVRVPMGVRWVER